MVKRTGTYRPCTGIGGCGQKGWVPGPGGKPMTHRRCAGDGWIRVGSSGGGRGGSGSGAGRKVKRVAAGGATVLGGAWVYAGTAGVVVVALLVVLVVGLAVYRRVKAAGW